MNDEPLLHGHIEIFRHPQAEIDARNNRIVFNVKDAFAAHAECCRQGHPWLIFFSRRISEILFVNIEIPPKYIKI